MGVKNQLKSSEWLLVGSLLAIMACLVFVSKISARSKGDLADVQAPQQILITIEGAVQKPGKYLVMEGELLESVVKKARPKIHANLQKIPLKQGVTAPLHLQVEELDEIHVRVKGAVVEPQELILPKGTRICDLKSKISLSERAEKSFFRRRKQLKEGEILIVPEKNS